MSTFVAAAGQRRRTIIDSIVIICLQNQDVRGGACCCIDLILNYLKVIQQSYGNIFSDVMLRLDTYDIQC